ncbi:MAG: polysaccharide deacetylase family protein [Deltaproteobacteria bacterium]|nr:polysaccharide deacetylase family protein [Deltaproteobacteria bacterium]
MDFGLEDNLASLTIDLDNLNCYRRIHGLPERKGADPTLDVAIERIANFLDAMGIKATLFAVASDLEKSGGSLTRLSVSGHEIANHSLYHDYRLAALPAVEIARDIKQSHEIISGVANRPVRGFRAPGYTQSPVLMATIESLGYAYDSSLFPCPSYGLVKNMVRAFYRLKGRPSGSMPALFRTMFGIRKPYRTKPSLYWKDMGQGFLEMPISVAPVTGLPVLGTLIATLPSLIFRALVLAPCHAETSLVNMELHAMDFVEANDRGVEHELAVLLPELHVPMEKRLLRYAGAVRWLSGRRKFVTLEDAVNYFPY